MNKNRLILTILFAAAYVGQEPLPSHGADEQIDVRATAKNARIGSAAKDNATFGQPASAAQTGQRDYRQELQYDSRILQIRSQLHGIAKPQKMAVMSSLVPGRVMSLHQSEGSSVSEGDKLVSLDDRLLQAQVESARIEAHRMGVLLKAEVALRQAERRLKRIEQASLKNATAGFEREEAAAQVDLASAERDAAKEAKAIADADLKLAEEQLRRNTIYAPFDGVVIQLHQKPGATVDPSLPIVTLADLTILEVEMYVPVDRFGTLAVGNKVTLQASAPVNRELAAQVLAVSPVIDSASNTFRCVLAIDNAAGTLPAGFSVLLAESKTGSSPVAANK